MARHGESNMHILFIYEMLARPSVRQCKICAPYWIYTHDCWMPGLLIKCANDRIFLPGQYDICQRGYNVLLICSLYNSYTSDNYTYIQCGIFNRYKLSLSPSSKSFPFPRRFEIDNRYPYFVQILFELYINKIVFIRNSFNLTIWNSFLIKITLHWDWYWYTVLIKVLAWRVIPRISCEIKTNFYIQEGFYIF
jgi:hypothetical protein